MPRLKTLDRRILMQHRNNVLPLQFAQEIKKQPFEKKRLLLYSVVNLKVFYTDMNQEIRVLYGSIYLWFTTKWHKRPMPPAPWKILLFMEFQP
jgi:hypothetical protein